MACFNSANGYQQWIESQRISLRIQNVLIKKGYDTSATIKFLSENEIDLFSELNSKEKECLKRAIQYDSQENNQDSNQSNATNRCPPQDRKWNSAPYNRAQHQTRHDQILDGNGHGREFEYGPRSRDFSRDTNEDSRSGKQRDSDDSDESPVDYEQVRWREFGMARPHPKWKKDFNPVEIFSPDGFWSWNSAAKSQIFGNSRIVDVWNGFTDNSPGWLLSPPVLLPSSLKSYKLTFNLRVKPNEDDDYPMLQIVLVNDIYNKRIYKDSEQLTFHISIKFINVANGLQVGDSMEANMTFSGLHESFPMKLPGRILQLKKPPIISCVTSNELI